MNVLSPMERKMSASGNRISARTEIDNEICLVSQTINAARAFLRVIESQDKQTTREDVSEKYSDASGLTADMVSDLEALRDRLRDERDELAGAA